MPDLSDPILAAAWLDAASALGRIFYFIVLPMLLLAGTGFALQRRGGLDMPTLKRLNFFLVMPAIIFYSVVTSRLAGEQVLTVVLFSCGVIVGLGLLSWVTGRARGIPASHRATLLLSVVLYNSGNFGLPLQDLAFRAAGRGADAMSLQAFVMITQNVFTFTVGVLIAAGGSGGGWRKNITHMLRFPPIYALIAGLVVVQVRSLLGDAGGPVGDALEPFWSFLLYVKDAFIAVALLTLGAQLALVRRGGSGYPVGLSVALRLLGGPAVGLAIILLAGLEGFLAQVLLIASASPTAINCMLLCLEFDAHPDYAARSVFYSTLLAPVTVTAVVFAAQSGLLPGLPAIPSAEADEPVRIESNPPRSQPMTARKTTVSIEGDAFCVNGQPTYPGREFEGMKIEGLLMNSRMIQATFDDLNPETRGNWNYPDGPWDPDRNTREFLEAMPAYREHGLIGFTVNFQGGNPRGYGANQPWHNSAFETDGTLRPDYLERMGRVLDRADELGMVPILGLFYFGQDERLSDEQAVLRATDNAVDWVLERAYRNVVIEICNETDVPRYEHEILTPARVHELIERVQQRSQGKLPTPAGRLLVSVSTGGGTVTPDSIVAVADFLLLHGNGVKDPDRIREMVRQVRQRPSYRGQPVLFNEDDHFRFDEPDNNMRAAVGEYAGWGYFDWRMKGEGFDEGYQSVPVNWSISSDRKRGFFGLLKRMTGGD